MLNRANIQWSAKTLTNLIKKGAINFDLAVQRGYVWDLNRKSLLIHSMLIGFPIPAMFFSKSNGEYSALDGKQRSMAISEFINNKYALSQKTPPVETDDGEIVEIAGKKFNDLSEEFQDIIKDFSLTIYYYDNITDEEISELFFRINNGKPLSATELTRVRAKDLKSFQEIAKHNMILKAVNDRGRERYNDENIAMQVWGMLYVLGISFNTRNFRPIIESTVVKPEEIEGCNKALDYVFTAYNRLNSKDKSEKAIMRKICSKTSLVFCAYLANLAIDSGISVEKYVEIVHNFFNTGTRETSINGEYNESVKARSCEQDSVLVRQDIAFGLIQKALEEEKKKADFEW